MTDLLDRLAQLIAFDTVSDQPNAPMIDYLAELCGQWGGHCTKIPGRAEGKAGLVARFGPDVPGGIVLSGHCDVVPITGQNWTRPAFEMTRDGDKVFGRGTTDMKGFLACMLDAAFQAGTRRLRKPLTLVFSYDEEIGCVGIQEMRPALKPLLGQPQLCIVGEPTGMEVAIGHKAKTALRAEITGQSGHSALAPHFVNALHISADFMARLRALQQEYATTGAADPAYDVPYTTLHIGTLHGGSALNIVPDRAEMLLEYRALPCDANHVGRQIEEAAQKVLIPFQEHYAGADITLHRVTAYPGLDMPETAEPARLATALANTDQVTKVAFGTEAGVFAEMGLPSVVCGPGFMADHGHKPDECIEIEQFTRCRAMLGRVLDQLC